MAFALSLALGACGGGGGSTPNYTIAGTVSGLASGEQLTLQDNNVDTLTVNANGPFTFATPVRGGGAYSVTVTSQPTGQTCTISNGTASSLTGDVTDVTVQCSIGYYAVGGTLSGLNSGQQLMLDNGSEVLTLMANGTFSFKTQEAYGSPYLVTIGAQPGQQFCTVSGGGGTVAGTVTAVQVTCASDEQVLYTFTGPDGANPEAGLIMDNAGNLYGTTMNGGSLGLGAVFELSANGTGGYAESILHSFTGFTDGDIPIAGLIVDSAGNLYGTTRQGGPSDEGVVFKLSPAPGGSYVESVLHAFTGITSPDSDGGVPGAALIMDSAGNLYGTTLRGDIDNAGVVFELSPSAGGSYVETELYRFNYTYSGINDGAYCLASLVTDSSGNLYGTTDAGGNNGFGIFFKLSPGAGGDTETILYNFTGLNDGGQPMAGLIFDAAGNLYGTGSNGGSFGYGVVFEFSPNGTGGFTERVLYTFTGGADGGGPVAQLLGDTAGNFYGTTVGGGSNNKGVVFELSPTIGGGYTESVLYSFTGGSDGGVPLSDLIMDSEGNLYGTTYSGGSGNKGVVFKIRLH